MAIKSLIRRRGLIYPGGFRPGYDPTHIAAANTQFSAISQNGSFVNLVPGFGSLLPSTINGTVGYIIDGGIGPAKTPGTNNSYIFTSAAVTYSDNIVMAAIIRTSASDNSGIFTNTGTNVSAAQLAVFGGSQLYLSPNSGGDIGSGISLSANTPYFVVGTKTNLGTFNFLALNLNTGKITTSTVAFSLSGVTGQSGYTIGYEYEYGDFFQGRIAAVMHANNFLTMSELLTWAADPWSFWYPTTPSVIAFDAEFVKSTGGSTPPTNTGLPILGIGG